MTRNTLRTFLLLSFAGFFGFVSVAYAITVNENTTLVIPKDSGGTANVTLKSGSTFDSFTLTESSSLSVTMSSGQSFTLESSDKLLFTRAPSTETSNTCGSTVSTLSLSPTETRTYTVTMGDACTSTNDGSSSPPPPPSSSVGGGVVGLIGQQNNAPVTLIPPPPPPPEGLVSVPSVSVLMLPGRELGLGDENDDVRKLQELLASDSSLYPEGKITGYYGSLTVAAVKRFQARHGLKQVGRVGPATLAKIQEIFGGSTTAKSPAPSKAPTAASPTGKFERELELGMQGDDVAALQMFLASDSSLYPEGKITGYYGSLTVAAVKRFQARHGLKQVGRVGPATLAKLNELAAGSQ